MLFVSSDYFTYTCQVWSNQTFNDAPKKAPSHDKQSWLVNLCTMFTVCLFTEQWPAAIITDSADTALTSHVHTTTYLPLLLVLHINVQCIWGRRNWVMSFACHSTACYGAQCVFNITPYTLSSTRLNNLSHHKQVWREVFKYSTCTLVSSRVHFVWTLFSRLCETKETQQSSVCVCVCDPRTGHVFVCVWLLVDINYKQRKIKKKRANDSSCILPFCCDKGSFMVHAGNNAFGVSDSAETPQWKEAETSLRMYFVTRRYIKLTL